MTRTITLNGKPRQKFVYASELAYRTILLVHRSGIEHSKTQSEEPGNREYKYIASDGKILFNTPITIIDDTIPLPPPEIPIVDQTMETVTIMYK